MFFSSRVLKQIQDALLQRCIKQKKCMFDYAYTFFCVVSGNVSRFQTVSFRTYFPKDPLLYDFTRFNKTTSQSLAFWGPIYSPERGSPLGCQSHPGNSWRRGWIRSWSWGDPAPNDPAEWSSGALFSAFLVDLGD